MIEKEEFDRIVGADPDECVFVVFKGVDGARSKAMRLGFVGHVDGVLAMLQDPGGDFAGYMGPVAGVDPLARRVLLETVFQRFTHWLLTECPQSRIPRLSKNLFMFIGMFREMTAGVPEYSGEFEFEGFTYE